MIQKLNKTQKNQSLFLPDFCAEKVVLSSDGPPTGL